MSNAINAAEQLRNFWNKVKPLQEAGEFLDSLGNLQQAEAEAKNRAANARKDADAAAQERDAKQAELKAVEAKISEAEQRAVRIAERADNAAKVLISGAEQEAAEIVRLAENKKAGIEMEIAGHQASLKSVQAQIEEAAKELANVKETITATKAKIAGL